VRALAANDRDLHLVNLLKTQHVLLAHRDTPEAAVLRCTALADRIIRADNNTRTSRPHVFVRSWSGRRFCSTTRVLPQAPRPAIR
jgi:hypothetical protein